MIWRPTHPFARLLLAVGIVLSLLAVVFPAPALAAGGHAAATPVLSVKTLAVSALCGWVIPPLVDLVTKARAATALKTGLATLLAALAGALNTVVWAPRERWQDYLLAIAVAVVNTQSAHRILVGLGDPVQKKTGHVGIGPG